jgi:aspartate carbamoyltransferase catalytic subunit
MLRNLISITDLSKAEILKLLERARQFKMTPPGNLLQGKILASCFFEPSTRTRLSFEAAILRLGGQVIGFADSQSTSVQKGESLTDSIKVIGHYADVLVLRHPMEGAARLASLATEKPLINAGDGANQHPTQTLVDLFSILETQQRLDELRIAFVGDLKYSRTIHSLALACGLFDIQLYFVSHGDFSLPGHLCHELRKNGVKFSFHPSLDEVIGKIDILYISRLQKERQEHGESVLPFILDEKILTRAKQNLKVFHALPRVNEIDRRVDETPFAYYFQQAANGLYVRQALLTEVLLHD